MLAPHANVKCGTRISEFTAERQRPQYSRVVLEYITEHMDDSRLWLAYEILTNFISRYEDVYAQENEIRRRKKWRDELFTGAITTAEKIKLSIIK